MQDLFYSLGIDWKLLLAQVINFFILFFIIYKLFAKPINNFLEERKKAIEEGYRNRDYAEKLIKRIQKLRRKILAKTEKQREEILSLAYKQKEAMIQEFQKEVKRLREEFYQRFEKEKEEERLNFYSELKKEIPQILEKFAFKIFHNQKLNREFIEKILNE